MQTGKTKMTPPRQTKLKCYFVGSEDSGGVCYILPNRKSALKMRSNVMQECDIDEFIEVKVWEVKDADISGMPEGRVDDMKYGQLELVQRGIYSDREGVTDTCPICKIPNCDLSDCLYTSEEGTKKYDYMCSDCEEKKEKEMNK